MKTQLFGNNIKPIKKANKRIYHSDNFINYLNYKTNKPYLISVDENINEYTGKYWCPIIHKKLSFNVELLEKYHYMISGVYINKNNKKILDKIDYVSRYLTKIYVVTENDKIKADYILDKPIQHYKISYENDSKGFFKTQYDFIMEAKRIDIDVSHNHPVNKFVHFWSSILMIYYSYYYFFVSEYLQMVVSFFIAHTIRQSGHFFYERQNLDDEKLKFGHKNDSKKATIATLLFFNGFMFFNQTLFTYNDYLFMNLILCVLPHYLEIIHKYGFVKAFDWMIKIITDPFTDLADFYKYSIIHPKHFLDIKDL